MREGDRRRAVVEHQTEVIRQAAEVRCASELAALRAQDRFPRPPGWHLSPRMVETFILGSEKPIAGADGGPAGVGAID